MKLGLTLPQVGPPHVATSPPPVGTQEIAEGRWADAGDQRLLPTPGSEVICFIQIAN